MDYLVQSNRLVAGEQIAPSDLVDAPMQKFRLTPRQDCVRVIRYFQPHITWVDQAVELQNALRLFVYLTSNE